MTLQNYKVSNNGASTLEAGISAGSWTLILATGTRDLFPSTFPFFLTLEQYNASLQVTKREIVKVTAGATEALTIVRSAGYCPDDYAATTLTNTAFSFDAGDSVKLKLVGEIIDDINAELASLATTKFPYAGGTLTGQIGEARATAVASASTVNLGALAGNFVHITGTTTITSFGSATQGLEVSVVFDGALTLTHNGTSLILPNAGNNISTAAGDTAVFRSEGGSNWKCIDYTPINGQPLVVWSPEATKKSYTAGTTIAAGEHVRMGVDSIAEVKVWSEYATSGDLLIGYNTTNQYGGQSFTTLGGPTGKQLKSVSFIMNKFWTPTGDLTLKIYSNTGSTLIGTSSNTVAESGISATIWTPTKVTFTFAAGVSLSNSTIYYLRIETNRANSTSNYVRVIPTNGIFTSEYSGGQMYSINSGNTWTAQATFDLNMQVNINYNEDLTRVYKTSAFYEELCDAIGAADSAGTAWNPITVDTQGVNYNQSVASGSKYFLSDTEGAISTTPGTNRVEVGVWDGTTRIRLSYQKDFRKKHLYKMYKDNSEATITKKYFHSLGRKPSRISFDTSGQNNSQKSSGFYDAEKWQQFSCYFDGSAVGASDAKALQLWTLASGQSFVITAVDEDSFTGTWTKAGTPTQVWYLFATIE